MAESTSSQVTHRKSIRVLIVDDTPDIRDLIRLTLGIEGGFDVVGEAADGQQAIDEAARLKPDLVLLDLSMPIKDGLEALPEIKFRAPRSLVLVLSGFNARQMGAEASRLGASGYMEKGAIAEKLGPRIRELFPEEPSTEPGPSIPSLRVVGPAALVSAKSEVTSQEELISCLAHELMNPVTVIQGFAMTLRRAATSMEPEAIKQSADAIARGAKHLAALVQALSDLRKLEVDALDLIPEETNLADLVRECVTDMAEITQTSPLIVHVRENVVVQVDPMRVRQIIINLLSNAAKFAPPRTRIEVAMEVVESNAEISVRDYGPGIPTHKMSELFQKFSRLGTNAKGTGLGLYISRGIARAHGGDLVLASSDGGGCRFVLRLPCDLDQTIMSEPTLTRSF